MPPCWKTGDGQVEAVASWIRAGAVWPPDLALSVPQQKVGAAPASKTSELENVRQIRERIATGTATQRRATLHRYNPEHDGNLRDGPRCGRTLYDGIERQAR